MNQDREDVWAAMAEKHPTFLPEYDITGNHHAIREIVLGGSVTWKGVHQRFQPFPHAKVMDVGANTGVFSIYCALAGADVVAYEPFTKLTELFYAKMPEHVRNRIAMINVAVSTHTGTCQYLGNESVLAGDSPAFNGSIPTDGVNWNEGDRQRAATIPCISLDDAIGGTEWDMVKIDIEGAESEVLLMASVEKLKQIKFMYLEFHPWVSKGLYDETVRKMELVFNFEGAYWNSDIGRWEAAYLHAKS